MRSTQAGAAAVTVARPPRPIHSTATAAITHATPATMNASR